MIIMDEVLFRSSQKLDNLQVQLSLAATQSKDLLHLYSSQGRTVINKVWNNLYFEQVKNKISELWHQIVNAGLTVQNKIWPVLDLQRLYYALAQEFWNRWTKRDLSFFCIGFICGSVVGVVCIILVKKKDSGLRYMQAIQCINYLGVESATVVENAIVPYNCGANDVIISVKAASVQSIDAQICNGYGKTLRRILQRIYSKHLNGTLPVTLGRDCSGIVTDIGSRVKRLEIGDEVWVTVPFWHQGLMSQTVMVPDFRVGRKPKNIGFEGACSLPYAGTLALSVFKQLKITQNNAGNKRFLVLGGCTPIGCVLIQILKSWKANITTTCTKRAMPVAKALGANDIIIIFPEIENDNNLLFTGEIPQNSLNNLEKELELRDKFDFVIITKNCGLSLHKIQSFSLGTVVSTLPEQLVSDSCGAISGFLLKSYIYFKFILEKLLRLSLNDFDEGHMCHISLNELAELVENGCLQTVVDKVLHPQDIEIALNHIQSWDSIGSTIITFR